MTIYYTIYQTTNLVNNKIYIGQHKTKKIHDRYLGSGTDIKDAIEEYGYKNFKKEILFIFDNKYDMDQKEIELVTEEFIARDDNYNIKLGGYNSTHSEETKIKIGARSKGRNKGKTFSNETRAKMSAASKGKPKSDEARTNMSAAKKGKTGELFSDEHKQKISIAKKGKRRKPFSDEHKQKMSKAKSGTIWITNGTINKRIPENSDTVSGFWRGQSRY